MKGMGQFNPEFYQRYRPFYPVELFQGFEEKLAERGFSAPFKIADIGCGTGLSALSLLKAGLIAEIVGVDPDPLMLEKARENSSAHSFRPGQSLRFQEGSGEKSGLPDQAVDALIVGSAFHWMDPALALSEFHRALKPGGLIRIFEYQFPKALHARELNEWIRRQFNLYWKAPGQVPRGSLAELTRVFQSDARFELASPARFPKVPMVLKLNSEDLAGLIFSQSRVLHFEATIESEQKIVEFRDSVSSQLRTWMKYQPLEFDFKLSWFEFGKKR